MGSDERRAPHGRAHLFAAAFASVALLSGVVYGWPSMRRLLVRNAVLAEGCARNADGSVAPCAEQELRFGLVYTLGSYANQFARLPIGIALDGIGPRRTVLFSAIAFAGGAFLFGLADNLAALAVGFALIGAGGAGVQLAVQSTASLFPERRSFIMALLSGAFQVSSVLYLLAEVSERAFPEAASRVALLCAHAAVALAVAAAGLLLWPDAPFGVRARTAPPPHANASGVAGARAATPFVVVAAGAGAAPLAAAPAAEGAPPFALRHARVQPPSLHGEPFWTQASSREYLLQLCFFSVHMLPAQFTVGTIGVQLEAKGDSSGSHTRAYSAVFAAAALATPFAGHAIDRWGFPPVMAAINAALCCCYAVLMVPLLSVQPIAYVLYSVGRVCLWAQFFAYCAAEFGFAHYGKLAGGGLAFGSFISLLQYAALAAVLGPLRGDFFAVNAAWCVLALSQFAAVYALATRLRTREGAATVAVVASAAKP